MMLDKDNDSYHSCDDTESEVSSDYKEESPTAVSMVAQHFYKKMIEIDKVYIFATRKMLLTRQ
eukprot:6544067-Ditylum_brightwellii.AAC.1